MQISFGQIFKTNVYLNSQRVRDEQTINKITNLLSRNLSGAKSPEKYGNLTHQQRIMLRMFDKDYSVPEKKKSGRENDSSTVRMVNVPENGRFMIVGKKNNDEMSEIRHKSIGIEHYHKGRSIKSSYRDIYKNNALAYIKSHLSPYEINIQAKESPKGDYYISLIDFTKSKK